MSEKVLNEKEVQHAVFMKALITGVCGGIIWTIIWLILYGFNMVRISPGLFWYKLFMEQFTFDKWYMYFAVIVLNSILSIIIAMLYYALFKKIKHWSMGAFYGLVIWATFLFVLPFFYSGKWLYMGYPIETSVGLLCLCILYGLFIGYSISFDYERLHLEAKKQE